MVDLTTLENEGITATALVNPELAVVLEIIKLILQYGLPVALGLIKDLQTNNPTSADIQALTQRVPSPDSYEKGGA